MRNIVRPIRISLFLVLFCGASVVHAQAETDSGAKATNEKQTDATPSETAIHGPTWQQWTTFGVGLATASVGTGLYLMAQSNQTDLQTAMRDSLGRIRSVTQRDAAAREESIESDKQVASSLIISGAVLVSGALIWWAIDAATRPVAPAAAPATPDEPEVVPYGLSPTYDPQRGTWSLSIGGKSSQV